MKMQFLLLIVIVFGSKENENVAEYGTKSEETIAKNVDENLVEKNRRTNVKRLKTFEVTQHSADPFGVTIDFSKIPFEVAVVDADKQWENLGIKVGWKLRKIGNVPLRNSNANDFEKILCRGDACTLTFNTKTSKYIGVICQESTEKWIVQRWCKNANKALQYGSYKDEETAAHASDTLAKKLIANGEQGHKLNFPDDNTEVHPEEKKTSSKFIGVGFNKTSSNWRAQRQSTKEKKTVYNGYYNNEETAAHASDTLAKKLMANGEQGHRLNFLNDDTEINKRKPASKFIGVCYNKKREKWFATRWSNNDHKIVYNGFYKDEEIAAHASDTLARNLMANGEHNLKLNFPDDDTEVGVVNTEKTPTSKFIGVTYNRKTWKWRAQRWSKTENKAVHNGYNYSDEEIAVQASDTLARKLMANGEHGHKLNFPDDDTEVHAELRAEKKFSSNYIGVSYRKEMKTKWSVQRHSKEKNTTVGNGSYKDEKKAAHASDILARKLMANGEQGHKLNFPDDETQVNVININTKDSPSLRLLENYSGKWQMKNEHQNKKRKRSHDDMGDFQNN